MPLLLVQPVVCEGRRVSSLYCSRCVAVVFSRELLECPRGVPFCGSLASCQHGLSLTRHGTHSLHRRKVGDGQKCLPCVLIALRPVQYDFHAFFARHLKLLKFQFDIHPDRHRRRRRRVGPLRGLGSGRSMTWPRRRILCCVTASELRLCSIRHGHLQRKIYFLTRPIPI